jgi:hypothetical protein
MGLKVPFRAARWAFWKVPFRSGKMGLKVPFRGGKMGQKFLSAAQRWVKSSLPRRKDGSKVPFRGGKMGFLDRRKFLSAAERWVKSSFPRRKNKLFGPPKVPFREEKMGL